MLIRRNLLLQQLEYIWNIQCGRDGGSTLSRSPCDHSTELEETRDMAKDCPSYQLLSGGKRTLQDLVLGGLTVANTCQFEVRKETSLVGERTAPEALPAR